MKYNNDNTSRGLARPFKKAQPFGQASASTKIWLDGINCDGNEPTIESCKHQVIRALFFIYNILYIDESFLRLLKKKLNIFEN